MNEEKEEPSMNRYSPVGAVSMSVLQLPTLPYLSDRHSPYQKLSIELLRRNA